MEYSVVYRDRTLNGKINRKKFYSYSDMMKFARSVAGRVELNGRTVIDLGGK